MKAPPVSLNPKSVLGQGLQNNLNSKETILRPHNREKMKENPSKMLYDAYLGKKKRKNEDKERTEARMAMLDSK
jgi:hypothetical protein